MRIGTAYAKLLYPTYGWDFSNRDSDSDAGYMSSGDDTYTQLLSHEPFEKKEYEGKRFYMTHLVLDFITNIKTWHIW